MNRKKIAFQIVSIVAYETGLITKTFTAVAAYSHAIQEYGSSFMDVFYSSPAERNLSKSL
jgi:hypothetical protein